MTTLNELISMLQLLQDDQPVYRIQANGKKLVIMPTKQNLEQIIKMVNSKKVTFPRIWHELSDEVGDG